jgi:hypothetical protein
MTIPAINKATGAAKNAYDLISLAPVTNIFYVWLPEMLTNWVEARPWSFSEGVTHVFCKREKLLCCVFQELDQQ